MGIERRLFYELTNFSLYFEFGALRENGLKVIIFQFLSLSYFLVILQIRRILKWQSILFPELIQRILH